MFDVYSTLSYYTVFRFQVPEALRTFLHIRANEEENEESEYLETLNDQVLRTEGVEYVRLGAG